MELYHYDCNYELLETVTGVGVPVISGGFHSPNIRHGFMFGCIQYTTDKDDRAKYMFTEIRKRREFHIKPKKKV